MTSHVLSGVLAVLSLAGLLLGVVYRPGSGPAAGPRHRPRRAWCLREDRLTPHRMGSGGRRCLTCKPTTTPEEWARG